ncbi:MAG: chemotaxis protein CheD [Spirochaetota bacterium]|nr:chemotaxis protein CheD [Spirochaetota bacterium]
MRENEIDVRIGEMEVAKNPKILKTILGSCVALILYDKANRIGGMAHIFLPEKKANNSNEPDSKFANTAVPALLDEVIKLGAKKPNILAFMVGGGNIFKPLKKSNFPTVAELNVKNTQDAIKEAKIPLLGCDVGRDNGCKVSFDLSNGDMQITDLENINKK